MRFLGGLLFLLGGAATAYATWATYNRPRPKDVVFAVGAPLAMLVALTGLLLIFVPGFFS